MGCAGGCTTIHAHQEGQYRVEGAEDGMRETARGDWAQDNMPTSKSTLLKRKDFSLTTTKLGFYKYLKGTVELGGRKERSEQFNMDEDGTLLD